MHGTLRPAVVLTSALLLATACESPSSQAPEAGRSAPVSQPTKAPTSAAGMPSITPSDVDTLEGRVEDVQVAGHYTYLRISEANGVASDKASDKASHERWAVVMGESKAKVGDALTLKVHGSKTDFHSRRLDRDFDEVFFARIVSGA